MVVGLSLGKLALTVFQQCSRWRGSCTATRGCQTACGFARIVGSPLAALACVAAARPVSAADREAVVATVGDEPIRAGEVERLVAKATRARSPIRTPCDSFSRSCSKRSLPGDWCWPTPIETARRRPPTELAAERAALKTQLAAQRRSIDDLLKAESIGQADLDRQFAWNVVWRKYVARYATEERLAAYFAAHRRDFDGTQLVVSHILLRPSPGDAKTADGLLKQAEKIRQEIIAGKLTFAEAARKYSAGPSGKDGGRLGPIGRHGPMDESFSRAAFALEVGQVSQPVKTTFGVHLIRCDEIKPGTKKLADVRKELEDALSRGIARQAGRNRTPATRP